MQRKGAWIIPRTDKKIASRGKQHRSFGRRKEFGGNFPKRGEPPGVEPLGRVEGDNDKN